MAEQMAESLRTGAHDAIHDMEATAWDLAVDLRRAQDAQVRKGMKRIECYRESLVVFRRSETPSLCILGPSERRTTII